MVVCSIVLDSLPAVYQCFVIMWKYRGMGMNFPFFSVGETSADGISYEAPPMTFLRAASGAMQRAGGLATARAAPRAWAHALEPLGARSLTALRPPRRAMPPSLKLTERCAQKVSQLLVSKRDVLAVRLKMVNDWTSTTGFSFQLDFATSKLPGEEMIEQDGARLFVESQALFNTETGLLGCTLDLDDELELSIIRPTHRRDTAQPDDEP